MLPRADSTFEFSAAHCGATRLGTNAVLDVSMRVRTLERAMAATWRFHRHCICSGMDHHRLSRTVGRHHLVDAQIRAVSIRRSHILWLVPLECSLFVYTRHPLGTRTSIFS